MATGALKQVCINLIMNPGRFPNMASLEFTRSSLLVLYDFWAAAPKGTKSCRTQGDFCLSCLKKQMR